MPSSKPRPPAVRPDVVVVGPLPPPMHGHMVTTERVLTSPELQARFAMHHVDISDHRGFENVGRLDLVNVLHAGVHVVRLIRALARRPQVAYIPLAQNRLGLLRDVLFVALALTARSRVVGHVHGGGFSRFLQEAPRWFRAIALPVLRRCAVLVGMSAGQCAEIKQAVRGPDIALVRHGTESTYHGLQSWKPGRLRALFVASSLSRAKGIDVTLRAVALAEQRGVPVELTVVGPWLNAQERRLAEPLLAKVSSVTLLGDLDREAVQRCYAEADVLVFPTSDVEGFGLVRIEAMAAGTPVITTPAGGADEIIMTGKEGLIVGYDDLNAIATALGELAEEPEKLKRMSMQARERQQRAFTPEAFSRSLGDAWQLAMDGAR